MINHVSTEDLATTNTIASSKTPSNNLINRLRSRLLSLDGGTVCVCLPVVIVVVFCDLKLPVTSYK